MYPISTVAYEVLCTLNRHGSQTKSTYYGAWNQQRLLYSIQGIYGYSIRIGEVTEKNGQHIQECTSVPINIYHLKNKRNRIGIYIENSYRVVRLRTTIIWCTL